jgi:hypothetical protein
MISLVLPIAEILGKQRVRQIVTLFFIYAAIVVFHLTSASLIIPFLLLQDSIIPLDACPLISPFPLILLFLLQASKLWIIIFVVRGATNISLSPTPDEGPTEYTDGLNLSEEPVAPSCIHINKMIVFFPKRSWTREKAAHKE